MAQQKDAAAEPWARRKRETDRAFAAFCAYRDLGPRRRLRDAAAATSESYKRVKLWSQAFGWADRASAWDDHRDEVKRRAELEELETMARRHAGVAMQMQAAVAETLERVLSKKGRRNVPLSALPQWIKVSVEVERLARGAHTGHVVNENVGEAEDFEELLRDPEIRADLVAAATRAAPVEGDADKNG